MKIYKYVLHAKNIYRGSRKSKRVGKINKYIKMEVKTSTVKQVQPNGTWESKYGLMYKFEVQMTNGDAGQYMSKFENQDKFKQGMVVSYEYHAGDFPKIKPHFQRSYEQKFGDGGTSYDRETGQTYKSKTGQVIDTDKEDRIMRQSSVRSAVEFCKDCTIEQMIQDADIIYQYAKYGTIPTNEL